MIILKIQSALYLLGASTLANLTPILNKNLTKNSCSKWVSIFQCRQSSKKSYSFLLPAFSKKRIIGVSRRSSSNFPKLLSVASQVPVILYSFPNQSSGLSSDFSDKINNPLLFLFYVISPSYYACKYLIQFILVSCFSYEVKIPVRNIIWLKI